LWPSGRSLDSAPMPVQDAVALVLAIVIVLGVLYYWPHFARPALEHYGASQRARVIAWSISFALAWIVMTDAFVYVVLNTNLLHLPAVALAILWLVVVAPTIIPRYSVLIRLLHD